MSEPDAHSHVLAAHDAPPEPPPERVEDRRNADAEPVTPRPVALVVAAAWLLPGLGYWLLGLRARAIVSGATILLLFVLGLFVGGVRVVDVPGYREGQQVTGPGGWIVTSQPVAAVLEKPWFLGQILAGPVTLVAGYGGIAAAQHQIPKSTAHVNEFGTLYTAVAGMLNLLVLLDAGRRSGGK